MAFFEDTDILETPFDIFMFDSNIDKVTYRAHWHNYVEFLYIYEGHITVECDNVPYSLNPGDSLVIMPKLYIVSIPNLQVISAMVLSNLIILKLNFLPK